MASPVYESDASAVATAATSLACDKPTGTVEGDFLLAQVIAHDSGSTDPAPATPTGWTLLQSELQSTGPHRARHAWFYKNAGGSEPSSYTFDFATTVENAIVVIARISGHDSAGPVDIHGHTASSITCPTVTTTVDECLVVRGAMQSGGSVQTRTAPTDTTEQWQVVTGSAADKFWGGGATHEKATAGATGTAEWTSSNVSLVLASAYTIAIAPAEAAAGTTLDCDSGSYTITGTAATLSRSLVIQADAGSYLISGTAVDFLRNYVLVANSGSYVITGTDATLFHNTGAGGGAGGDVSHSMILGIHLSGV